MSAKLGRWPELRRNGCYIAGLAGNEFCGNSEVPTGINKLLDWLLSWFDASLAHDSFIGYVLAAFVHIFLLLNLVAVGALAGGTGGCPGFDG